PCLGHFGSTRLGSHGPTVPRSLRPARDRQHGNTQRGWQVPAQTLPEQTGRNAPPLLRTVCLRCQYPTVRFVYATTTTAPGPHDADRGLLTLGRLSESN